MGKIVVTSALPYANGSIHIGHLVEYIQTDIFVRFLKLIGKDAIYCCADDTHGTPIEIKATQLGIKPEELIAKFHKEHQKDFADFNIHFDSYYSTNSPENKKYADQIFLALKDKGLIYTKEVESFYDKKAKRYLPDRYVKGECPNCGAADQYGDVCEKCNSTHKPIDLINPYSTVSGEKPVRKKSMHYFFKLSSLSDKLENWFKSNKKLQPEIINYLQNWIKKGLQDWDISRDGPYFGFKIPGESDKYYYVWLDAPIGYIASTQNYCKKHGLDAEKEYWKNSNSEIIHFIGKDIIYFHFLFWPAMLMESGFNLPNNIVVHGFLTVKNEKMSKSRGTFLTAREYLNVLDPEYLRFYYAAHLSHKLQDLDLEWGQFKDKINNELVANVGNFVYRVLSFCNKNFDSKLSRPNVDFLTKFNYEEIKKLYEDFNFNEALKKIQHISSEGNKYFQDNAPWKLIKDDREKAHEVITTCANLVKNLSILLKPILPVMSEKIEKQLLLKEHAWTNLDSFIEDVQIGHASILVKKIGDELEKFTEPAEESFSKLNIKVAKVEKVEDHPDADKLYIIQITLGKEKRQLVAGLRPYYKKEELEGKHICVITNLKPAKLRGYDSNGMLLAGDDGKNVGLLIAPKSKPGNQVCVEGVKPADKEIDFKEFQEIKLTVKDGNAVFDGKELQTNSEIISVEKVKDGAKIR